MDFERLLREAKLQKPEAKEMLYEIFKPLLISRAMISGKFSMEGKKFPHDVWHLTDHLKN